MYLPMDHLLGTATRKDFLIYTHRVKAKGKLNCTYENMSTAKTGERKTIVHFLKELEQNTNNEMKMTSVEVGYKQYCLQNPFPFAVLSQSFSISKKNLLFIPRSTFHKKSWHHLCVNQVTVLLLPGVLYPLRFSSNSI